MPLTKQYLRYAASGVFSVVGSSRANIIFLSLHGTHGKFCAVAACEHVFIWDLRKGEKVMELPGQRHEVTILAKSPDSKYLAVGYHDGTIKIFDLSDGQLRVTFSGHKSAVSALNYDHEGVRLVSGSQDTDVIVWDIVNESGLFRLRGHKGMVTQARFLTNVNVLISSSKDTFMKFWDLDTQHCFRTLVGHKTEVWDFVVARNESCLITGSADSEMRVWRLSYTPQAPGDSPPPSKKIKMETDEEEEEEEDTEEEEMGVVTCSKVGSIVRRSRERVVSMTTDPTGRILGCHGPGKMLEVFQLSTDEEMKKYLKKRQKRARLRARESGEPEESVQAEASVEDEVKRLTAVRTTAKLRSFDCKMEHFNTLKVLALMTDNTIETISANLVEKNAQSESINRLVLPGHRSDVRTLSFSSDNTAILSASAETVKVWNRASLQCIRTIGCDYALCSLFTPGDRHIVLGTKSGKLQLFDIGAGTLLESVDAHSGAVWSICMSPDKKGLVSGSADHDVKFWDFELITDETYSATSKRLTLVHTRTLQMAEDVLCVKFSPDQRLLAVSLLDNTVKVFFADTLKFFLSLYGHKLPVLCMDISSDSHLIVTGSADRNVKLWGLDFGDCHKSIFAHDDSIMCVQFVPKTHMFFTGGKDQLLKQWDGDNFEHIITLRGHHAEVWCLAVSPSGNFVVTGSHDKSLRLWEKTEEPLILEEEREMEREQEYEDTVGTGEEPVIPGETNKEAGIAGKKTIETVKAAERIMEALELYGEEMTKISQHQRECEASGKQLPDPPVHPIMQAYGIKLPSKYVLEVLMKVKSSELEEALLVLPFSYVPGILKLLNEFIQSGWEVELCCRCLFFLLRIHQGQITSNQLLLPIIDQLRGNTTTAINKIRDTIGFNLAGLQFLQKKVEKQDKVGFFADATDLFKQKKKAKKRAILAIKT